MNLKEIESLIKFVSKSGVSEVELETEEVKITIKTPSGSKSGEDKQIIQATIPMASPMPNVQQVQAPVPVAPPAPMEVPASKSDTLKTDDTSKYIEIKSPMIGTFYRSASPEKPAFVNVGDSISEGSVICIIEAMKLFNEIESEVSGKIVKVLVDDSTPVEYDQPLFLVDPS